MANENDVDDRKTQFPENVDNSEILAEVLDFERDETSQNRKMLKSEKV